MRISDRKYAITGAGRGLGAALAIIMADAGAKPVLLGRNSTTLNKTAEIIQSRTNQKVETIRCDLADTESCTHAGTKLSNDHSDLDGLIHNGAMWLPGSMNDVTDVDIQACISSAAIGALILTRHVLPVLLKRKNADIHTVVSTSGLPNALSNGASIIFRAAKSAQDGFSRGLSDELAQTRVRVTAIYPGNIKDITPLEASWNKARHNDDLLTNKEVTDAIMFTLNQPASVAVKSLVIE